MLKILFVDENLNLQSNTVAAQVERGGLGTKTRSRSFSTGNETKRSSGSSVAENPQEKESQSGLVSGLVLEETSRGETDAEEKHEEASANKERTTTNVLAGDQRSGDGNDEQDEGDDGDEERILHAGSLEEVGRVAENCRIEMLAILHRGDIYF